MTVRELIERLSRWEENLDKVVVVEQGIGAADILGYHPEYGITNRDTDETLDVIVLEVN